MSDRQASDDTRMLRNAQANLIAIQAQRIAVLEARVDALLKRNADLEAEKKAAAVQSVKGAQA